MVASLVHFDLEKNPLVRHQYPFFFLDSFGVGSELDLDLEPFVSFENIPLAFDKIPFRFFFAGFGFVALLRVVTVEALALIDLKRLKFSNPFGEIFSSISSRLATFCCISSGVGPGGTTEVTDCTES